MTLKKTAIIAGAALAGCAPTTFYETLKELRENNPQFELEQAYPIDILGEPTEMDLLSIEETLKQIPKRTLENMTLEIIFAERGSIDPGRNFHGGYARDLNLILVFHHRIGDEATTSHEVGHAIHFNLNNKEEFDNKWKNIEIIINGETRKLAELYGRMPIRNVQGLGRMWNECGEEIRYGFSRPYGTTAFEEDIATMFEYFVSPVTCEDVPEESYNIMRQKADLMLEYGFINERTHRRFILLNNIGETIDEIRQNLYDEDEQIRTKAWAAITQIDDGSFHDEALQMMEETNWQYCTEASYYLAMTGSIDDIPLYISNINKHIGMKYLVMECLIKYDTNLEYKAHVIDLITEYPGMKKFAFEYFCANGTEAERGLIERLAEEIIDEAADMEDFAQMMIEQHRGMYEARMR